MELNSLISKLHPLERTVLPILKNHTELSAIINASKLQEIEVMRALQWLENKKVLEIKTEKNKIVILDKNGLAYQKQGLPEKKFLQALNDKYQNLSEISNKTKLNNQELNACIGLLKRKVAIDIQKEKELQIRLASQGNKLLQEGFLEEKFLAKQFPLDYEKLSDIDKYSLEELKKRKEFLRVEEQKTTTITLTELGKKLASTKIEGEVINRLTPEMLKNGSWKNKQFRAYDVEINVPARYGGKKHFVNQAISYAKKIWIEMGFKEMKGNMVTTSFWCLDALFVPQDHPARTMQDTFFLGGKVEKGKLPPSSLVKKIKDIHENGGDTGSKGWKYSWSEEEAKKNILRTHTTVLTSKTLSNLKETEIPAKFFAIGKCFRNEAVDWKHLFEFNQTEGIVVSPDVNFRHLLGYLRNFALKMGFPKVRFRPSYFPYTEPSVEGDVYDPIRKQWVEFIAAGMLRPEVVQPLLGKDIPVLAWGPGIDRMMTGYFDITDIRDLYKNDLKRSREMKYWMK